MVRLFLRELTAIPFVKIYAKSKKAECKFPERIQKYGFTREKALKRLKTEYFP